MAPRYNTTASLFLRPILVALLYLVCGAVLCFGQSTLQLLDINSTNFPTVTGRFYLFDADGKQVTGLSPADMRVTENSIQRKVVRVSCPEPLPPRPISSVLTIDISGSMNDQISIGMSRIDVVKAAVSSWIQQMGPTSECAITSFNVFGYLNRDFTNDKQKLFAAVSQLTPKGGTDYMAGFLDNPFGGLRVARRGAYKRVLVFLTDGLFQLPPNEEAIVNEAKQSNTEIYCIALAMPMPTVLKNVSQRTGGKWFEMVSSAQEAISVYRTILRQAENIAPCEIEWEGEFECGSERNVTLSVPDSSVASPGFYIAPDLPLRLVPSPASLAFGPVPPGAQHSLDVLLTPTGGVVTIDSIVTSDPRFTVTGGSAPPAYSLQPGAPGTIKVQFAPIDSAQAFGEIRIYSSSCKPTIVRATGGFYRNSTRTPLRLLAPNGGERFVAGIDTVMTWTGILPSTIVRLEYSTDAGGTWNTITSIGSDYSHPWHVPNTPSKSCLARVSEARAESPVLTLEGHSGAVEDANFSSDGASVVTVEYDGTIRIFDAITGIQVQTLLSHPAALSALFNPDGDQILTGGADRTVRLWSSSTGSLLSTNTVNRGAVYGLAYNSSGTLIATGGVDTAVKIWSSTLSSVPLWTFPAAWPVRSVAFNPQDKQVISGADDSLARIWNISTGNLDLVLARHQGPVTSVEFNRDGSRIVTADAQGVYLWDAASGTQMWHTTLTDVSTARFSPDGGSVAVSTGSSVIILEAYQGKPIRTLVGHTAKVTRASYSSDGLRIVSASEDGTARVWDLNDLPIQQDQSDALWEIVAPDLVGLDVDFGTVAVGASKDSIVRGYVKNLGTLPAKVDQLTFKGGISGEFSVTSGGPPFTLEPNEERTIEFGFRPLVAGVRTTSVEISTGAGVVAQEMRGVGVTPPLEISSTLVDFGPVAVGDKKDSTVKLIVRNTGPVPLTITGTPQAGPDMAHFSILQGGGSVTLQPGQGYDMVLRFAPTETGVVNGGIAFEYSDVGSPALARLFGEGIDEGVLLPVIDAPATSSLELRGCDDDLLDTLILVNTGRAPLRIDSARLSGPDADNFSLVASVDGASIEPRDTLRLVLRFSCSTPGQRSAQLLLANNDPNDSLHLVELIGRRQLPGFRLSVDTIDLGLLCPDETRDTTVALINIGEIPLDVRGSSESLFAVEGTLRHIDTAMQTEVPIRFMGSRTEGEMVGEIVFVDTVCGSVRRLVVRGEVSVPVLAVDPLDLVSNGGRMAEGDVVVRNVSNRDVRIEGVTIDGSGLRLVGSLPVVVSAGGEAALHVVYEGSVKDTTEYKVDLIGSPCEVGVVGFVRVVVRRGWTRVEVGSGSGRPGDRVRIPLRVTESAGLTETDGGGYEAEIRFDRSVLLPVGGTPMGRVEGGDRVIRVKGEGSWSEGELGELEFIVGLGGVERTDLELVEFRWSDTTIGVEGVDGGFEVLGVCGEPVSRLYRAEAGVGLKSVRPNPGGGVMEIEYEVLAGGETEMYVVDLLGQRVKEVVKGEMSSGRYISRVEVGELSSGQYVCILRTGGTQSSLPIVVRR